jgi:RNAse (barnase) inhibitor barstar
MAKVYTIDGSQIGTLEDFFDQISRVLIPRADWGRNLDAFNDILRGGFGTPDDGFVIHWIQSDTSRARLGYVETAKQLEIRLGRCHPSNRTHVSQQLREARAGIGPTVFDWLVEIIKVHGADGDEADDNVSLVLM